jgi:hypothetical protein
MATKTAKKTAAKRITAAKAKAIKGAKARATKAAKAKAAKPATATKADAKAPKGGHQDRPAAGLACRQGRFQRRALQGAGLAAAHVARGDQPAHRQRQARAR